MNSVMNSASKKRGKREASTEEEDAAAVVAAIEGAMRDEPRLDFLRGEAISWATTNGLLMGHPSGEEAVFTHAPLALLPTPFPREAFLFVYDLAPLFNRLVDQVARHPTFLSDTLRGVLCVDDFTANLYEIYKCVKQEGEAQDTYLGIHRSDYMLQRSDVESGVPSHCLQVEINTISASFGCLSSRVQQMHSFLLSRHLSADRSSVFPSVEDPMVEIPDALAAASLLVHPRSPLVLMVVQPGEKNSCDQRCLEYELWRRHKVPLIRRTLAEVHKHAKLDANKELLLSGVASPVSVCYLRAGYSPKDYTSAATHSQSPEWSALLMMERSRAIKCPSVAYHLAGTKRVQQRLSEPGVMEAYSFLNDAEGCVREARQHIRRCFGRIWAFDGVEAPTTREQGSQQRRTISRDDAVKMALERPENFVLKPCREGGGNNLWGSDMVEKLKRYRGMQHESKADGDEELSAYILMERIWPDENHKTLMRLGKMQSGPCFSEIGIFGCYIGSSKTVHMNRAAGYLVRSKLSNVTEGGVAAGYSCLDSLVLVKSQVIDTQKQQQSSRDK